MENYLHKTLLLFCDDDMVFEDIFVIDKAYRTALNSNSVISGHLKINQVNTVKGYSQVLKDTMQLFLEFKHDCGLNLLAPRGMLLENVLKTS